MSDFAVVVPTIGRPGLGRVLAAVEDAPEVVVVDDRARTLPPLTVPEGVRVLRTGGQKGPAAARNRGWRAVASPWVAFLDDDVVPTAGWLEDLRADVAACGVTDAATQGRVEVPLPDGRRPTDRERNVAGLAAARWITADMAYQRAVLRRVGGFDERFRRAYREDSDLALRVLGAGWDITRGRRRVLHPATAAPWWVSIRDQRGNRDDVMMRRLHGPGWRERSGAGRGMAARHLLTTLLLASVPALALTGRRRGALMAAGAWAAATGEFARGRIAPGPRTRREVAAMAVTSAAIPPTAIYWRALGLVADRRLARRPGPDERVEAVLFDRDGTLVVDVPYNGDPAAVRLVPGAGRALDRLRDAGIQVGVVTNQSGVGRGLIGVGEVDAVHGRLERLAGPFDIIVYCPHTPEDDCRCRKPAPGLITEAARRLRVDPRRCVVVGDILSDVLAAEAAGARAVLVPNARTAPREVRAAEHVVGDLPEAARLAISWREG